MWPVTGKTNTVIQICATICGHKLYYDRFIITDQNVHNNRPDTIMFDKTIKQIDAATPNSHILNSTLTEKLHKSTDLKEELIRI